MITLNVEPVGPALWIARFSSGLPLLAPNMASYRDWVIGCVKTLGLNVGFEPIASTWPLVGSSATKAPPSAPGLSAIDVASARWPTCWRCVSIDSFRFSPAIGSRPGAAFST